MKKLDYTIAVGQSLGTIILAIALPAVIIYASTGF